MTPENGKPADGQKATRHRSPNYPGISLKTASEKITGWFARDGHVAAIKDAAIKQMGGDPGRVASALKSFGLIVEENGRIKLTQRGLEIAARKQDDAKRKQAMKDAALSPSIYRDLAGLYAGGLPSDSTLQSELITDKHFNKNYVDDFIKDFRETLEIAGISGSTVVESNSGEGSDDEKPQVREGDYVQWESQGVLQFKEPRLVRAISDDGQWVFVESSEVGLLMSEVTKVEPHFSGNPPAGPPSLPLSVKSTAEQQTAQMRNAILGKTPVGSDIPVAKDCVMGVAATGRVTQEGIEKLIAYLGLIKGSFPNEGQPN